MGTILKGAIASAAFVSLLGASIALAAAPPGHPVSTAPGQNKIACFDGGGGAGGTCTLNTKGAKGSATLETSTGGAAGVYYLGYNDSIYNVPLAGVSMLSFNYTGTATGGAPRFSIPIDEDNSTTTNGGAGYGVGTEAFAFAGAALCNNGNGLVDVIKDATCDINYKGVDYANWAAFAAAFPNAVVSFGDYVFVIADEPGTWTVNNVIIGKPGK